MRNYTYEDALAMVENESPGTSDEENERMAEIVMEIVKKENESPERAWLLSDTYKKYWDKL